MLKRNLDNNPVYPFEEIEPNIYVLTVTTSRYYIACGVAILTVFISGLVFGIAGEVNEYIIFPAVVVVLFGGQAYISYKERRYVLDSNELMYEYYRGNQLIYRGHYHNVYIRLKGQSSGGGDTYYTVVLDGFNLNEEAISANSTKLKKLAKLARKLATRLNVNYFDSPDKSRCHVIRHQCPYKFDGFDF